MNSSSFLARFREMISRLTETLARNRILSIAAGVLLAILLLFICFPSVITSLRPRPTPTPVATPTPETVSAEGTVLPSQRASLAFKIPGRVVQVPAKEGDAVKAGATLVRLDDSTFQAQVAQAEAAYRSAQINLDRAKATNAANVQIAQSNLAKVLAGATPQEIAVAEGRTQEALTGLARAQQSYDTLRWIGGSTEADVRFKRDQAEATYNTALADLNRLKAGARHEDVAVAQAQLDLALGDAGKAEIKSAEAQVAQTKAALDVAKAALQDAALFAPFDGTVALVSAELNQSVSPGTLIVQVGNLTKLEVETTDLAEVDVAKVAIGQTANVTADAFPDKVFKGQVVRIAASATDRRGDKVYKVVVSLGDDAVNVLRWGMTTKVDIVVGQ
jgi:multidrug efflux pump subunit AcrA (membrane-fusion protein)